MRKILLLTTFLFISFFSFGQCPTDFVNLYTQAQVNQFFAQYPNCTALQHGVNIGLTNNSNVSDLSGFSQISSTVSFISILGTQLTSLNGLQNIVFQPGSSLGLRNNDQLTNLEHAGSVLSEDFSLQFFFEDMPNLASLPDYTSLRFIYIRDSQLTDLSGLESITTLSLGIALENNPNLTSLNGLNAQIVGHNEYGLISLRNDASLVQIGNISVAPSTPIRLTIVDNPVLIDLAGLEEILIGENVSIQSNPSLTSLNGLNNVEQLQNLLIEENNLLSDLSGLESVSQLQYLEVSNNLNISSLTGLQGVTFIGTPSFTSIRISDNPLLTTLDGLTAGSYPGSGVRIQRNPSLQNLDGLEAFTEFYRGITITDNDALLDLEGLSNVVSVESGIAISNNNALVNVDGLNSLVSNGGTLSILNNDVLENLDGFSNITTVSTDPFRYYNIADNPMLQDISGLENLDLVNLNADNSFRVENNPMLATCDVQSICDLIANNGPAEIIINQNAPGCNSENEVVIACGLDINTVSGAVKFDFNADGCDLGDVVSPNVLLETTNGAATYATFSNNDGAYQNFIEFDGLVTTMVNPSSLPPFFEASPASQDSNFTGFGNEDVIDFCLTATESINDLKISLLPTSPAVPGFDSTYDLVYENVGTTQLSGQVTLLFDESRQVFVGAIPSETSLTGGLITWDYIDLNPFESRIIKVTLNNFPPPANEIGDEIPLRAQVFPIADDASPGNNTSEIKQIVVGAFDPNDKNVVQGSEIPEAAVGKYLDYVVRFQNTGNANATFVIIDDVLDNNLEWGSLRPLSASHDYRVEIINGNEVSFIFDDINLPPEITDPEGSQGYMAFQIRTNSDLVVGDVVENTAAIIFDFNPPIITNTVSTTVVDLQPPVAICQSITVALDNNGQAEVTATDIDNGSSDTNGIASLELDITTFDCSSIGENTVTLTVTDTFGNVSECTAVVTVVDNMAPVLACQSIVVSLDESGMALVDPIALLDMTVTTDNCGIETIGSSLSFVDCSAIDTPVEVTVFVEDINGNIATCTTTITAIDELPPVFEASTLPIDQIKLTDETGIYLLEDFTTGVLADDNCTTSVTITQSPALNEPLAPGVYDITITASDAFNNTTDYTFELTVELLLGTTNFSLEESIILYPNPVKGVLTIKLDGKAVVKQVSVYSIEGKELFVTSEETIDCSSLPAGIYFVRVSTEQGSVTKKIVKASMRR